MTVSVTKYPGDKIFITNGKGALFNLTTNTSYSNVVDGRLTVYGDLLVVGAATYVDSTVVEVTDNIIVLNRGEVGAGVTLGTAGIEVDRGSASNVRWVFDETYSAVFPPSVTTFGGLWKPDENGQVSGIVVSGIRAPFGQNINFLGAENSLSTLNVRGTTNYESQVLHDDDIPNKKYVDDAMRDFDNAKRLLNGDSSLTLYDDSLVSSDPFWNTIPKLTAKLNGVKVFDLYDQIVEFSGIKINDTDIESVSKPNIDIKVGSTGTLISSGPLSLRFQNTSTVAYKDNLLTLYSKNSSSGGGTGLYFVNNTTADELVSKKKAVVFSIIF